MHPAISGEIKILSERFPEKSELTLTEYATYFNITRSYASQHIRLNNIPHKELSRVDWRVSIADLALWLANKRIVNGKRLNLTPEDARRKRGFCQY